MLFEKATRLKVRFLTNQGHLDIEDLWDLSLASLNTIAKELSKRLKENEEEDFLDDVNEEDEIIRLKFDLVIHVLNTKKKERKDSQEASKKKAEREKILGILARKQDEGLESLSEDELKKRLEELKYVLKS